MILCGPTRCIRTSESFPFTKGTLWVFRNFFVVFIQNVQSKFSKTLRFLSLRYSSNSNLVLNCSTRFIFSNFASFSDKQNLAGSYISLELLKRILSRISQKRTLECTGKPYLLKAQHSAFNISDSTTIALTVQN